MKIASTAKLLSIVVVAAFGVGQVAQAEQFGMVRGDSANLCPSGKSDSKLLEGPDEVSIVRSHSDDQNVAVCVDPNSVSGVHIRWKANGYWKSSGTISHDCAEITGASKVKVRAVNTNFHEEASYYTCVRE